MSSASSLHPPLSSHQRPIPSVLRGTLSWSSDPHAIGQIDEFNIASLVPRPSPPPVFDRLQYAKTKGGGQYRWHTSHISLVSFPYCKPESLGTRLTSPSFCILQVIKNWSRGRSGNKATTLFGVRRVLITNTIEVLIVPECSLQY